MAAIAAFVMVPHTAIAAAGLSYNYLQISYIDIEFDDIDPDADGGAVAGSGLLSEQVYAFGSFAKVETDTFTLTGPFGTARGSLEFDQFTAGLGFRHELQPNTTDLNLEAAFIRQDVEGKSDFSGFDDDDNGYGLGIGIRHLFTPQFEVNAGATYVDIFDDDDTSFGVAGLFHFTSQVTAKAGYSVGSDSDSWEIGLRLNF